MSQRLRMVTAGDALVWAMRTSSVLTARDQDEGGTEYRIILRSACPSAWKKATPKRALISAGCDVITSLIKPQTAPQTKSSSRATRRRKVC